MNFQILPTAPMEIVAAVEIRAIETIVNHPYLTVASRQSDNFAARLSPGYRYQAAR
jgi:hypothetical protein